MGSRGPIPKRVEEQLGKPSKAKKDAGKKKAPPRPAVGPISAFNSLLNLVEEPRHLTI